MRVKLSELYVAEREEICKKIIEILKLDEENSFLLSELDADEEKKKAIMDLKDDIPKYFAVSALMAFMPGKECLRPALCIAKGILRQQGYFFEGKSHCIKIDGGYERTVRYFVFRKK